MCGIVGYVGPRSVSNVVLVGLERLEYRGYDSCGIAVLEEAGEPVTGGRTGPSRMAAPRQAKGARDRAVALKVVKTAGRLPKLRELLEQNPVKGSIGIGHTRWATHGQVTDENAHPFVDCTGRLALVHNGIIENYRELREQLQKAGHRFVSGTDTEVIVHLVESCLYQGGRRTTLLAAIRRAVAGLRGAYSLALLCTDEPDRLYAVKMGSPLIIGQGRHEYIVASDAPALTGIARRMLPMLDGEVACISRVGHELVNFAGRKVERAFSPLEFKAKAISKGRYPHFMRKEIFEQPRVIADGIAFRFRDGDVVMDPEFLFYPDMIESLERIVIQACGTSYHAGLVGRYYIERFCRIPVSVEISSELRTSEFIYNGKTLMIPISQSGETADTLAAMRVAASRDIRSLAILNVRRSSIDRESDSSLYIHAGPEIGVASTKAYTAQIFTLLAFALYAARIRRTLSEDAFADIVKHVRELPGQLRQALRLDGQIRRTAARLSSAHDFLFLGRGINYPSALEGALKLKEISYVHATGYPAGEMKHGPISLINDNVPVIGIAPQDSVYEKMVSNLAEAKARKGLIIAVATDGDRQICEIADTCFYVPRTPEYLSPMVVALPLQLLAYHIAVLRGCDVDKPRNLAKSVTVE